MAGLPFQLWPMKPSSSSFSFSLWKVWICRFVHSNCVPSAAFGWWLLCCHICTACGSMEETFCVGGFIEAAEKERMKEERSLFLLVNL